MVWAYSTGSVSLSSSEMPMMAHSHELLISPWCHMLKLYVIEEDGISVFASA